MYEFGEELFFSCPQALVDDDAIEALEAWAWAEKGFLPRAGGVDDQLERDLQLIAIVSATMAEKSKNKTGR